MQGYGLYWCLVEMLYEEGGWLNLKDIEDIAYDVRVDTSVIESLVRDFDLFFVEGERFSSNAVLARLKVIEEKSSKAARSARARWSQSEQNANVGQTQSEGNANALTNDANALQDDANAYISECDGNAIKEKKRKEIKEERENTREEVKNETEEDRKKQEYEMFCKRVDGFYLDCVSNAYRSWAETSAKSLKDYGIRNLDQFYAKVESFRTHIQSTGETHRDFNDFRAHVIRWIRAEFQKAQRPANPQRNAINPQSPPPGVSMYARAGVPD